MKKLLLLSFFPFIIIGCSFIDKLQKATDTVDKIEMRYFKKAAINQTELALVGIKKLNQSKTVDEKQVEDVAKCIDNAFNSVQEYKTAASGIKPDNFSSKKAVEYVRAAKVNFDKNFKESAEVCLSLAVKYMLNSKIALWQYQTRGNHVFPDYLKWGSRLDNNMAIVDHPDTLVFSGGGAKGVAYAGVLKYFEENGTLNEVKRYIGTSAGSIICSFMSVGQYYEENKKPGDPEFSKLVYDIIMDTDLFSFVDNSVLREIIQENNFDLLTKRPLTTMPPLAEALDTQYALCSGDTITSFFEKSFERIGLDKDITLNEHYKKTGKHLVLVSCSLSYRRTAYFDYKTAPNMKLVDAIRASMAVPYVFKPVKYNNDFFIDGGVANNYPIDYFDFYFSEKHKFPKILGFMLFGEEEMLRPEWEVVDDPLKYALAIIKAVMINTGRSLFEKNIHRTVFIDCGKIDIMSFNMTQKQKTEIINAGYIATKKYFDRRQ